MHPHMALPIEECVEQSHLKEKITAIVPTAYAPIETMMWAIFSLLLRSKPNSMLEHICVSIAGPDSRTGDTSLMDQKQAFLEELRDMNWYHTDAPDNKRQMPLTVSRVWSRVGYAETMEMALSWVHTDAYLLMHDDVIIKSSNWLDEAKKLYSKPNIALACVPPLLGCKCDHAIHRGMYLLRLPQVQTTFLLCKKKWIMKAGASWCGYHIPSDDNILQFDLCEIGDIDAFFAYYREKGLIDTPILTSELYNFVRQEVGAWIYYKLYQNGNEFVDLDPNLIVHLEAMTRTDSPEAKQERVDKYKDTIISLEAEIDAHPQFGQLYRKYLPEKNYAPAHGS